MNLSIYKLRSLTFQIISLNGIHLENLVVLLINFMVIWNPIFM